PFLGSRSAGVPPMFSQAHSWPHATGGTPALLESRSNAPRSTGRAQAIHQDLRHPAGRQVLPPPSHQHPLAGTVAALGGEKQADAVLPDIPAVAFPTGMPAVLQQDGKAVV